MAIEELHICGYRSIRDMRLSLGPLNVLVGPNGCGKTNLYRALFLLARAADGRLAVTLAEEGGMPSVLWAGERRHKKDPVRMTLAVRLDSLEYELQCGLPRPDPNTAFNLDPLVKEEHVWFRDGRKKVRLLERERASVFARNAEGIRITYPMALTESESVLSQLRDPQQFSALAALSQEFSHWRFYHQFRTDFQSPLRHPQVGVRSPVLDHDGRNLAAALRTIQEIGDRPALQEAVGRIAPGAELIIEYPQTRFHITLQTREFRQPFDAWELSDGTLHYLCLLAALLSPRPPALLALNEPEGSIHADLLEPLAELMVRASRHSQLWITTHSEKLAGFIQRHSGITPITLEKVNGETRTMGEGSRHDFG